MKSISSIRRLADRTRFEGLIPITKIDLERSKNIQRSDFAHFQKKPKTS